MSPGDPSQSGLTTSNLQEESSAVLLPLRDAARRLLESGPTTINRATDLQTSLDIRAPLAWQFYRLATTEDLFATIPFIPLPEAMDKVLSAARKAGFSTKAIDSFANAYARFEEFVTLHAGNRATFDAIAAGLDNSASELIDVKARRAAFRASAQLWGVQAATTYRCLIFGFENRTPPAVNAIIQGSCGVRALRPRRSVPICRRTITISKTGDTNESVPPGVGTGLLEDFCSANLPRMKTAVRGHVAHDLIELTGLGLTSKIDVFLSNMFQSQVFDTEPDIGVTSMIRTPCEEFVADMLAPAGTMDTSSARVRVHGCMEDVSAAETASDEYLLPSNHKAEYLGRDLQALHLNTFVRCPEMVRFVLRDIGRSREEFDIFRCRIRYPMLHTCIALNVRRA